MRAGNDDCSTGDSLASVKSNVFDYAGHGKRKHFAYAAPQLVQSLPPCDIIAATGRRTNATKGGNTMVLTGKIAVVTVLAGASDSPLPLAWRKTGHWWR